MKTYEQLTDAIMKSKPARLRCRFFFQGGYCRSGDACRFSHDAPAGMTREEALKTIPCPHFAAGTCSYGEHCELLHEGGARAGGDDLVCGICLENVQAARRKFGVLSCCDHVFCFTCLMEWRTEGSREVTSRRVCPACRKSSDYVVPSPFHPRDEDEKERVISDYRNHCATIPCKHFEVGKHGTCPFGRDCLYAHLSKKGKDIKKHDKSMQQLYEARVRDRHDMDRERDIEYIADMVLMMGLQRHLARQGMRGGRGGGRGGGGDSDSDDDGNGPFEFDLSDILAAIMEDDELGFFSS